MERPGLVKVGDRVQITEYQSYMNYSYIIEPAVAMSGCYTTPEELRPKKEPLSAWKKRPLVVMW